MNTIDIIFLVIMAAIFTHLVVVIITRKKISLLETLFFTSGIFHGIRFLSLGTFVDAISGIISFLLLCSVLVIQFFNLDVEILGIKLRNKKENS